MAKDVIADLVAQISIDGTQFQKGMGQVNRQLKTVQEELKSARSRFRQTGDATDLLGNRQTALSGKLQLQKTRLDLLKRAYEESKNSTDQYSSRTQGLATQLEKAKRELSETEHELEQVNRELAAGKWKQYGEQLDNAGRKLQNAGRSMSQFGKSYTTRVTAPILAGGAAVFKLASDWEASWVGVEKVIDGTDDQLLTLRDNLRGMTKEMPATHKEIANVAASAGQLGIETENIEEFSKVMLNLGVATNMTADQAATSLARLANITNMSADDYDRLGATIVGLGNNLATTEQEIVDMGLRLAGAGDQIGLTQHQTLAFAGALSSVGIAAEAGGSAFSKVMVNMQLAAEKGGEELDAFAKVAGVSAEDFRKSFQEDAAGAMITFIEGLSTAEERGLSAIGILDDMGISEVRMRDALLRAAGASDLFAESLDIGSKSWEENLALTEEAEKRYGTTESQLKILLNRIKDIGITLGNALIPAVMDALDAAEPLIDKIESGAQAFADMSEEEQRTVLKTIALVAAAGPAIMVMGNLTTAVGGVARAAGLLSKTLGVVRGAGLLARLGGLSVAGPVGLAIAGVGGLVYAITKLTDDSLDLHDVNYDVISSVKDEIEAIDDLTGRFDELQNKNRLSTDEMMRYMDVLTELESAQAADKIKALTEEQEKLLEKSGLTNKEMDEFLNLNDQVIEKSPDTTQSISEQGNAYAENTQALKDLNEEKRKELLINAERELINALENEVKLIEREKELTQEVRDINNEIEENKRRRIEVGNLLNVESEKLRDIQQKINEYEYDGTQESMRKKENLEMQKREQMEIVNEIRNENEQLDHTYDALVNKLNKKGEDLDVTREEMREIDTLKYQYENLILSQADITAEKGKGIEKIEQEIEKVKQAKKELDNQFKGQKKNTEAYRDQNRDLNTQLSRLETARGKLSDINELAGQTVYDKRVDIKPNPSISRFNQQIGSAVAKRVTLHTAGAGIAPMYAEGTDSHPGGPAIAGELGPELARHNNKWAMLDFGLYDLPRRTQVFTHDDTKRMLGALNNIPAYAGGVGTTGKADQFIKDLQPRQMQGEVTIYTTVVNEMDGRELSRRTYKHTQEFIDRDKKREGDFA
ncbi:Protein ORF73 [Lentibacillus sp. JNUCC-1]|uniref:phage tail tape measure protein n=1 Tax=Lentibacillus sp. JNUCC-1 TaxID=2654513 RepID=UPI0012E8E356|nr:phage tail tape measure protein [Lentibacillus sp. JNUCC-1]MUV39480.1 Protein ORF73 [Lentibacillus sp. JNUCC-1]